MSVEAMSWVLNHCTAKGTEKLVMIGIANHADNRGRNAWPSVATLARYANVSPRSVQYAIERLVAAGELKVQGQRGGDDETRADRRPNRFVIVGMQAVDTATDGVKPTAPRAADGVKPSAPRGEAQRADGVKPASPEPSLEPSMNHDDDSQHDLTSDAEHESSSSSDPKPYGPDELVQLCVEALYQHAPNLVARKRPWTRETRRAFAVERRDEIRELCRQQVPLLGAAQALTELPPATVVAAARELGLPVSAADARHEQPAAVISLEVRQATSHVAGLCLTGALDEARDWITVDCPEAAVEAAWAEFERRTGTRSSTA